MKRGNEHNFSNALYATSLGLQLGVVIVIPVGICMAAGLWADKKVGSLPLFLMAGTALGVFIAYREAYSLIKPLIGK